MSDFEIGELEITQPTERPFPEDSDRVRDIGKVEGNGVKIVVPQRVLKQIVKFSESDQDREVGGFLAGRPYVHERLRFIEVEGFIPAEKAVGTAASLRITHESGSAMQRKLKVSFPDAQVVGWHHTHPGYSVFLSSTDTTTHKNFFSLPWMVALVVDPKSGELGFFGWDGERIVPKGFTLVR